MGLAALWALLRGGWLAPADPARTLRERYASTRLTDRHGRPLRDWTGPLHTRTRPLNLQDISPHLIAATLCLEDQRFFSHPGIDLPAIARAAWSNLARGHVVSGASTLTQQVVKLLAPRPRTLAAKAREALTALHLEARHDKREILQWYFNFAPYGSLVRGAQQAALVYLQKPAKDLTLAEAAWLAVLPRSPSRLDPLRDAHKALPAQRALLRRMHEQKLCTDQALRTALAQPIAVLAAWRRLDAPHFADFAAAQLAPLVALKPAQVRTTLDAALQDDVARMLDGHLRELAARQAGNAAVVVIDNESMEVRVLVGSRGYQDRAHLGANNGATALRQPGSALKPITFAAAFDAGATAATLLADLPAHFATEQGDYAPKNYGGKFRGPLLARVALANSVNVAALKLLAWLGVPRLQHVLHALGLTTLSRDAQTYGLALTLGDGEVTLLDLTAAYAALARGGRHAPARWLDAVQLGDGAQFSLPREPETQPISPAAAFLVTDILADPDARRLAFGRDGPLELPFPAAVKTGTSKGFRDNWTLGYTPRWTVGVWVGNFDGTPMQDVSGVTGAAPLWHDVMLRVAGRDAPLGFRPAPHMHQADICSLSGRIATPLCPQRATEWFAPGTQPLPCDVHVLRGIDKRNGLLAGPQCPPDHVEQQIFTQLPPEYATWQREAHLPPPPLQYSPLCPNQDPNLQEEVRIDQPQPGAVFYRDSQLADQTQQLALVAHSRQGQPLQWWVDGRAFGTQVASGTSVFWTLQPGRHQLRADTPDRRSHAEVRIEVEAPVVDPSLSR